jgi:hypothetical protein
MLAFGGRISYEMVPEIRRYPVWEKPILLRQTPPGSRSITLSLCLRDNDWVGKRITGIFLRLGSLYKFILQAFNSLRNEQFSFQLCIRDTLELNLISLALLTDLASFS